MAKIINDKYYTPDWLVKYTVEKAKEIIGEDNISEFLEPSAGDGRFLNYLPKDTLAYDLEPEDDRIIEQDYLRLNSKYKRGRCIIGNPPYGETGKLYQKFCNKSFELGDYVVFILPISQLNNNYYIYKFDLIYSEDLGKVNFEGRAVHTCLNIYRKPENWIDNKRDDIYSDNAIMTMRTLMTNRETIYHLEKFGNYDLCVISWGSNMGSLCSPFEKARTIVIRIDDTNNYDFIVNIISNANWSKIVNNKGNNSLSMWHIYKHVLTEMYKAGLYNKDRIFLKGIVKY